MTSGTFVVLEVPLIGHFGLGDLEAREGVQVGQLALLLLLLGGLLEGAVQLCLVEFPLADRRDDLLTLPVPEIIHDLFFEGWVNFLQDPLTHVVPHTRLILQHHDVGPDQLQLLLQELRFPLSLLLVRDHRGLPIQIDFLLDGLMVVEEGSYFLVGSDIIIAHQVQFGNLGALWLLDCPQVGFL